MAKGRVQGVTYTRDRIIVGFFHTSFKGFFTIVLVAGGAGVQVDEAGSAGVAMAVAPTDGDRAASVEDASGPDAGPATAIVTSSAWDSAGFTPSASVGLASGVSATLWRWGLGKEDEGLQNRVVISISQNNSTPL
jgi:hypothetical protein